MLKNRIQGCLLLLLAWACSMQANARGNVDSLLAELSKSEPDTQRVNILVDLCTAKLKEEPTKALEYGKQACELAEQLEFRRGEARALGKTGIAYRMIGQYIQAVECFSKAAEIERSLGRKKAMAAHYGNIGHVYKDQGLYDQALDYYFKIKDIFTELNDVANLAGTLSAIGMVQQEKGELNGALENSLQARSLFEQEQDSEGIAMSLHNIGIIRYKLGEHDSALEDFKAAKEMNTRTGNLRWLFNNLMAIEEVLLNSGKLAEARPYLLEAVAVAQQSQDPYSLGLAYDQLGNLLEKEGKSKEALENYLLSLEIREKLEDRLGIGNSRLSLGLLHDAMGNTSEALRQLMLAADMFRSIEAREELALSYHSLANAYAKSGDYKRAWEFEGKHAAIKDTILVNERQELVAGTETKHDLESVQREMMLREMEIAKERAEGKVNVLGIGITVAIAVGGLMLILFPLLLYLQKRRHTIHLELQSETNSRDLMRKDLLYEELASSKDSRPLPEVFHTLSQREWEVVQYLSSGLKDKEIAEKLFLSVPTVKTHLARIYRKLDLKNRAEVIAMVHQHGVFNQE